MSVYGPCNFKLIIGSPKKVSKQVELPISQNNNSETLSQNISYNSNNLFSKYLPVIKSTEDIHKYILEIMKIEENLSLNEKYICSICLAINKNLLTKEVIDDILEEEFHLTLMKWLKKEKNIIEEPNANELYKYNIYIGLLINIITLYEIFPIKSKDLIQFHLYKNLFKLNKLIKQNINNSFPFLLSLKNLLKKWKKQIDSYSLSQNVENCTLLGIKTKRPKFKVDQADEKDKNDTEADSEGKEEGNIFKNKKKKVTFDLDINKVIFYNREKSPSEYLNQNRDYEPLFMNPKL